MPFQPIPPRRLADAVAEQIELLILRGVLRPGERLPPERELAERLDVSRPSLREALARLTDAGLLVSRASSGTIVSEDLDGGFPPALVGLFERHGEAAMDVIAFRRDIEGLAAERAARLGTEGDHEVIDRALAALEGAPRDAMAEAARDAEFHLAIVEASHNTVLLHMMRVMYDMLRRGVLANRRVMFAQATTREALAAQHRAIAAAIRARDPGAARAAAHAHMDYVGEALRAHARAEAAEDTARRKLAR
ncbi:MAG: FCD domain-containing protein [Hasllibacter sp.]